MSREKKAAREKRDRAEREYWEYKQGFPGIELRFIISFCFISFD